MSSGQQRLGLAFAGLCAASGAFVPAFAKLTTENLDPLAVATVTSLFAAACALVVLAVRGELPVLFGRQEGPRLALIGALGTALAFVLFFAGAERTSAVQTALCLQIEPVYALLVARIFLGHPITPRRVGAAAVVLGGIALALGVSRIESSAGLWFLLLTPLAWQASHVVVLRGLPRVSPLVLTAGRYVYGGLILALVLAVRSAWTPSDALDRIVSALPLLALQGMVLSYVGTVLWYQAIARLDLARTTAIVVPSIPLLSFGASFLLLGEVASARQWLGMLLTAAGVVAFVVTPHVTGPILESLRETLQPQANPTARGEAPLPATEGVGPEVDLLEP